MVRRMNSTKKRKVKEYPSLYDAFNLGDRVKRIYNDKKGNPLEYRGIVLAIDNNCLEIYWDTKDGKYRPGDMDIAFTTCPLDEIFNGDEHYTPIKKDER